MVEMLLLLLQNLSHKMSIKLTSSKKETAEEAEAIAKALLVVCSSCDPALASHDPTRNPMAMKKKELLQEFDPVRVLSPR